ncbi:hypothetical protein J0910_24525 [Nocardiopsis sp. CNT-189]|uniref:hypothetical protein n=1 Tax=Nocardiopsis oceanisediminis TaxID=2816862 RepID=UPI003B29AC11
MSIEDRLSVGVDMTEHGIGVGGELHQTPSSTQVYCSNLFIFLVSQTGDQINLASLVGRGEQ